MKPDIDLNALLEPFDVGTAISNVLCSEEKTYVQNAGYVHL